jgi:hypothetical protein
MGSRKDGLANHLLKDFAIQRGKLGLFDRRQGGILFRRETGNLKLG